MLPGQVAAFRCAGRQPNEQTDVTSIRLKIGGKFTMRTVLMVDPLGPHAANVLLVTCVESANPKKKTGRKPNPKEPKQ
jgi:hypothetical protein